MAYRYYATLYQTQTLDVIRTINQSTMPMPTRASSFSACKGHGKVQGKTIYGILLLIMFALWCWCTTMWFHTLPPKAGSYRGSPSTICPSTMIRAGVPTFKHCNDLGDIVHLEGFTMGLELGVQHGYYSNAMLSCWPKLLSTT
jgi:hypothetical protein